MKILKVLWNVIWRCLAVVALVFVMLLTVTSVSPIYKFAEPRPFEGEDIFNPYSALDTAMGWKKSVFHTHTRVKGPWPPNEGSMWPQETWDVYRKLGYEIVTFSNHNEITKHPFDSTLQVNVYEQGYGLYKYHKLVFGSDRVIHFDHLLPILASQKQWQLDYLGRSSDFIQMNHPYRTGGTSEYQMARLSGYRIMELDTHISTENEYWDQALSAGHYSFGLANDDLHHPERHWLTGIRCNFLCTPSGRYQDIKRTLLGGCYYSMRVPDYGSGDWDVKIAGHHNLPYIKNIGLDGETAYIKLSVPADSIRVNGQDHAVLALECGTDTLSYTFRPEDHFARITAFYPDGAVIYTNPFARYDSSVSETPWHEDPLRINWPLTVLFNLLLACLFLLECRLMRKIL